MIKKTKKSKQVESCNLIFSGNNDITGNRKIKPEITLSESHRKKEALESDESQISLDTQYP